MAAPLLVTFAGASIGPWRIDSCASVRGEGLPAAERLTILEGSSSASIFAARWLLRGTTSHLRYVERIEHTALSARQQPLGRDGATRAALIPICKADAWWDLPQDARRAIFEERSHHIGIGMEYLPAVARRLHHGRDLGEPFDFLTWFEHAPEAAADFERLVERLRDSEEWGYVEREIDIRLSR